MIRLLSGAALLAAFAAPAAAEPRYDIKLEKAVMKIVAARIGDIRGGFSYEKMPEFVAPEAADAAFEPAPDPIETGSVRKPKVHFDRLVATKDNLAMAAERKVSRIVHF